MSQSPEKKQALASRKIIGGVLIVCACLLAVGIAAIKVRGFRASAQPSAFETAAARAGRNFAIPGAEAKQVNPVVHDEMALQQGRDLFLTRCASCHGVDGRGTTPIGRNVFPRVPDLHAAATRERGHGATTYSI